MINDLVIKPEILEIIFLPPIQKIGNNIAANRIMNNKILFSPQIRKEWEEYFRGKPSFQLWDTWLNANIINANGQLKKSSHLTEISEDTYLTHAISNVNSLLVGNYSFDIMGKHPKLKFIFEDDIRSQKLPQIKLNDVKEAMDGKGRNRKWFSVFETVIELSVEKGQDAALLANFLLQFIKGDKIIIQDSYLATNMNNERNFEEYIYPHIKDKDITLIISSESATKHKKRLEQKYNVQVKTQPEKKIHESFIKDENYYIRLGYRFEIFGFKGKTNKENIHIRRC